MYRIAVLAEQEAERQRYAEQITRFCEAKGLFPQVMQYDDQERFFETAQKADLTNAVIALSGVAGLNAAFDRVARIATNQQCAIVCHDLILELR